MRHYIIQKTHIRVLEVVVILKASHGFMLLNRRWRLLERDYFSSRGM